MTTKLNKQQVSDILPQKEPFLFIDTVEEANAEKQYIKCVKYLSKDAYYFKGHFPGNPIMPGVLIVEAMAQASILLYSILKPQSIKDRSDFRLGKVDAQFIEAVVPDATLTLEVTAEKLIDTGGVVQATASASGKVCAKAKIFFGVKRNDAAK